MNVCLMLPAASRRRCNDNRSCRAFCGTCYFAARFAECADAAALPLGLVARAQRAHIGEPALTEGSTIYCGDYVSTEDGGSVLIRIGESSLELQSASAAHDEYHEYHSHKPCAPVQLVKGHSPIAAGQSRFMLVTGIVAGGLTAWGVTEALESPTRP